MSIRRMIPMGAYARLCVMCGAPISATSHALTVHELECLDMGWPVVTVASGGLPVVETVTGGLPVTEASNKYGTPVTKVVGKPGLPVTFGGSGGTAAAGGTARIVGDGPVFFTAGARVTLRAGGVV